LRSNPKRNKASSERAAADEHTRIHMNLQPFPTHCRARPIHANGEIRWTPFTIPARPPSQTYPEKAWWIGDENVAAARCCKKRTNAKWFRARLCRKSGGWNF
jgi:hypothetical protein